MTTENTRARAEFVPLSHDQAQAERKKWVSPYVILMSAGETEISPGGVVDAVTNS